MIDFGGCAVGDPACDLVAAWTLFDGTARIAFRAELPFDAATWHRARGWALWKAAITLAGPTADPAQPLRVIDAILRDDRSPNR